MSKDQIANRLTHLVTGLLATGHYTEVGNDGIPTISFYDSGAEWISDGYPRRYARHIIDHAESLLDDIDKIAEEKARRESA